MKRCLLLAAMMLSCALVIVSAPGVRAQTAPPAPLGVRLMRIAPDRVQLTLDDRGDVPDRYDIRVRLTSADLTDPDAEYALASLPAGQSSLDLPRQLPGVMPGHCYRATFTVFPIGPNGQASDRWGSTGQTVCGKPDGQTKLVDPLPPPAPPSDVRLVRDGAGWQLEWRDNSSDEAQFQPGVIIADETGGAVASVTLPPQRRDMTVLELPERITSEAPAPGCYTAKFYVFAVGLDGGTTLPGNGEAPVCIEGTLIRFPDAGVGTGAAGHRSVTRLAAIIFVIGAMFALMGIRVRLRV